MDGGFSRRFFFKTFFLVHNHPPSIFTPLRLRRCFAGSFLRRGFRPPTTVAYLSIIILRLFSLSTLRRSILTAVMPGGGVLHYYRVDGNRWHNNNWLTLWSRRMGHTDSYSFVSDIMDSFVREILDSFERFWIQSFQIFWIHSFQIFWIHSFQIFWIHSRDSGFIREILDSFVSDIMDSFVREILVLAFQ